jgi:hypothetical protein
VYFTGVCRDLLSPLLVDRYENLAEFAERTEPIVSGVMEWTKPSYDFSICFRTKSTVMNEALEDIIFTADYHGLGNIFENKDRDPLLDIGARIELRLLRAFWLA